MSSAGAWPARPPLPPSSPTASSACSKRRGGRRPDARGRRAGRILLARDPGRVHARSHHHQSEQRRRAAPARAWCTRRSSATSTSPTSRPSTTCGRSSSRTSRRVRRRLASTFGCDAEELAITRNASESLQIAQTRPRPEAGRRGPDDRPGLPAHADDVGAARAARRDQARRRCPSRCRRRARTTWPTCSRRPSRRGRR